MDHLKATGRRLALVGGVMMAAAAVPHPALAYDDGYQNVFSSVLTAVGVLSPEKSPEIDYRERAPLVLPPKTALVTPQQTGATRTAAWPNDPDVMRRKKAADDAKAPIVGIYNHGDDRPISKDEQMKYRAAQAPQDPTEDDAYGCSINHNSHCRIDPDEMKAEEERFKKMNPDKGGATLEAGVEPDRLYLTQPPKGYLKATKVVKATAEAPQPKRDDSGPLSTYIHPSEKKIDPLDN